jgi:predicted GIY-YIG superfamily endonuclease
MQNEIAPVRTRPGYLYRYWSTTGTLLYIGISINAVARLAQHKGKVWFSRIAKITVERFETYAEAEAAELRAICYEGPIHNVKGPRDAKDLGPALARLRAAQRRSVKKPSAKPHKLRGPYETDMAFGLISPEVTFAEYVERWPYFRQLRESK